MQKTYLVLAFILSFNLQAQECGTPAIQILDNTTNAIMPSTTAVAPDLNT